MATSKRREKQVEARIVQRAKEHKGTAYKFTSPGRRSVPDRLIVCPCIPPDMRPLFIEAKRPGEDATGPQEREHKKLRRIGATVFVADDYDVVDTLFESICDGSCKQ